MLRQLFLTAYLTLAAHYLAVCQVKRLKELKKFSYPLVGIRTVAGGSMVYPIGTCFFIRRGALLLLITAKHNLNGFDSFTRKPTPSQYDTIGIRYYNEKTKKIQYNSLNIIPVKPFLSNDYFFNDPDVVVLQIKDTVVEPSILSIENYTVEQNAATILKDSVFGAEYGLIDPTTYSNSSQPILYRGKISDRQHDDPAYPRNDQYYYTASPISIQGMSGGPVFYKTIHGPKGAAQFRFAGLIFGKDSLFNTAYIVPSTEIESRVQSFRAP